MIVVVLEAVPVVVDHFHDHVPVQKVNHHEDVLPVPCIKKHRLAEVVVRDAVLVVVLAEATAEIKHFTVSKLFVQKLMLELTVFLYWSIRYVVKILMKQPLWFLDLQLKR